MYTTKNFKTKKALREAVEARANGVGQPVTYYQPNGDIFGSTPPVDGSITVEGPHYPEPHRWYASCTVKNGEIVKVR